MDKQQIISRQGTGEQLAVMGAVVKFLCTADKTAKAWSLMEVDLPRDAGPPPHFHAWDEAYYVVQGEVRFTIGGRQEVVGAGDFIYAPGGTVHGFAGSSEQPARVLIFDAPAHAESFFREVDQEVRGPDDMAKVPAIGSRHGIEFLPPA